MIEVTVSLALNLLDGFTAKPLSGAAVQLLLDGMPVEHLIKAGGWFILTNLPKGTHELTIKGVGFQTETLALVTREETQERYLRLKPDASYRFGRRVTTLQLTLVNKKKVPQAQREVYLLTGAQEQSLRVAQDDAVAGAQQLRLFAAKRPSALPIPGAFWLDDGEQSEMLVLTGVQGQSQYALEQKTRYAHKRGCVLEPVLAYVTGETGAVFVVLSQSDTARLLISGKKGIVEVGLQLNAHTQAEIVV